MRLARLADVRLEQLSPVQIKGGPPHNALTASTNTQTGQDPKSSSPKHFQGLANSFLGALGYTTRLSIASKLEFGALFRWDFAVVFLCRIRGSSEAIVEKFGCCRVGSDTPYVAWRLGSTWQALRFSLKLPVVKAGEIKCKFGQPFIKPVQEKRLTEPIYNQ